MRFVLCHRSDEAGGCSRRVQDAVHGAPLVVIRGAHDTVHGAAFGLMPIDKGARIAT